MHICTSTYLGPDGQVVTCVKTEGHGGDHFSVDGEMWADAAELDGPAPEAPPRRATGLPQGPTGEPQRLVPS
ncbi:MAG: hypothetical protein IT193_05765 [Propionibacteriaceae bacterium]|nr:hypothetical protein [Propionibacteriaceae bacterium]